LLRTRKNVTRNRV